MKSAYRLVIASVALIGLATQAQAANGLLQFNIDSGGDEMVTAYYTDGNSKTINAGEFVQFSGGIIFPTFAESRDWETQLSIGYKVARVDASNGSVTFDRIPLEALQFIRVGNVRMGGGITAHLSPKLHGTGVMATQDVDFDNAWGGIIQVDFLADELLMLGARATMIDYTARGVTVDGSSIGVNVGLRFR